MSLIRRVLLLAAVFVLLPGFTFAQPLPSSPVPVSPPGSAVPVPPPVPPAGPPPVPPPPSAPLQSPLPPSPYAPGPAPNPYPAPPPIVGPAPSTGLADPGPNGWGPYGPPSGMPVFFTGLDLDVVKPVFKDHLQNTVNLPDGSSSTLGVPRTDLGWTVSPRFELGYKLPDSQGEFLIGYRFLVSDGNQTQTSEFGDVAARSRLNMNVIDLDYNSAWYSPGPRWEMQWTVGARIATVYYDTQINNDIVSESASNYFYGAGGHASLQLERKLTPLPSIGFFAKADGSVLVGTITQHFNETNFDANGNLQSGETDVRKTQSVEVLNLQAGVSYTPTDYMRFSLGYEYEHWFSLGRADQSTGELTTQGIFFRGEFDF